MLSERLSRCLHWLLALASIWLVATSPWLTLRRLIPDHPSWADWTHIGAGLALLPLGLAYLAVTGAGHRWRRLFPWLTGDFRSLWMDLCGIFRGRIPSAEGNGLFPTIKGLTILALVASALTGLGWFLTEGTREVIAWRDAHVIAARILVVILVVHVLAVAAHILELLRDG